MAEENNCGNWEVEKENGNQHYKNGRFDDALISWGAALDILNLVDKEKESPEAPEKDRDQQVIYCPLFFSLFSSIFIGFNFFFNIKGSRSC